MKKAILLVFALGLSSCIFSQDYGTGDNTTEADLKKILKAATRSRGDTRGLPDSFSIKQFAPEPQNQGKMETCVGWSTAYAARTISYMIKKNISHRDSIKKYAFSPGYIYYKIKKTTDKNCMMGSKIIDAMVMMKDTGAMLKKEGLEDCAISIAKRTELKKVLPYRIKDFQLRNENITSISENDIADIKKSLTEKKPVVISLKIDNSFKNISSDATWSPSVENVTKGHAMCIVGYNDSIGGGSFEVMNSYGTRWGNKGFFWLSYKQLISHGRYALELMDFETPANRGFGSRNLEISGSIEFIRWGGKVLPITRSNRRDDNKIYRITDTLKRGNWFQVKFVAGTASYIYVFAQDDNKEISPLFPQDSTISAAINSPNSSYFLPDEVTYGVIGNPGKENFCILYSKSEIDFKDLKKYIDSEKKTIHEAVKFKLAKRLIDIKRVTFSNDKIVFKAPADENSVLCFYVEMNHN